MTGQTFYRWAFAIAGVLALCVANAAPLAAQQRGTIRGTVREAASQRPVDGVQVLIPGTQLSTTTDPQGRFEITGVPAGGVQVRVRAPGYSSALATTMVVGGQAVTVDFALNTSVIALDEVVVTGTGASAERKQLGNTIATVKADMLEEAPVINFSEALAAREAGVSILPGGGLAGEGARIRIRGNASLSQSNEPVVYVDGVRINSGGDYSYGVSAGGAGGPSRLDDINPETIERIEILKGAAAATLYGSEASAGVIQIFTKKGSQGRPRFSFRIDQGLSRFPKSSQKPNSGFARSQAQADQLNAIMGSFMTIVNDDGNGRLDPFETFEVPLISQYYGTGYASTYSATVAGGGSDVTYNVAGRYARDNGPYTAATGLGPGALDLDRKAQVSTNIALFPREKFTLSAGMMYADTYHIVPQNANNIYGVQSILINSKPENANCDETLRLQFPGADLDSLKGTGNYGADANRPGFCAGPGNPEGSLAFTTAREAAQAETPDFAEHFNANIKGSYTPVQQVRLEATVGIDATNQRSWEFRPFGYNVDNFTTFFPLGYRGVGSNNSRVYTVDARGTWDQRFGTIQSTFVFGTQSFITKNHDRFGEGYDFPGPGLEVSGAGAEQTVAERFSQVVNLGILGQEQIGFNDWLFITGGGRWDRNSAFGENTSGVFYPKVSASIVVSDMPGWNSTTLSTVRVRGALGRSGLQPGAFDKFKTFAPLASEEGPGLGPSALGNPDLKAEVQTEWEAGAEIGLFNDRLGLDGSYWNRKTKDALVAKQFPVTGGFQALQLANIGELAAHGFDFKVNAIAVDRPGLSIQVFANTAYLWQKVVSMGGAAPLKVGGTYPRYRNFIREGQVPGVLMGAQLLQPCGQTKYALCLGPGQLPYDLDQNGVPDTEAEMLAWLTANHNLVTTNGWDLFNSPRGTGARGPLMDDNDNNGDFLDNCLGASKPDPTPTNPDNRYCLAKSAPDWSGSFGTNISLGRNWQINTLFEYKAGNFYATNLTDAFRKSHPLIGRNVRASTEAEAVMKNPNASDQERLEALKLWASNIKALSPYDGLNQTEKADFLRWREIGVTYNAPASFAQKLGLGSVAFNVTGRNVLLATGYTGIDPELSDQSRCSGGGRDCNFQDNIDGWGFPLPRRFSFSVRFGF